jgi:hypothetical protein
LRLQQLLQLLQVLFLLHRLLLLLLHLLGLQQVARSQSSPQLRLQLLSCQPALHVVLPGCSSVTQQPSVLPSTQ